MEQTVLLSEELKLLTNKIVLAIYPIQLNASMNHRLELRM